ncbi:Chaperone protein hscC (Hsc62) [Cronobacter condimenti 1330]|uniref:2-alkenal reductase n=1 Tax=Cronobacter condimenti 1330 TaxID=1073999 RepID=K8AHY4_9ENTR|nr:molecular chaperone HscC [Cronobacter condimenti]ALB63118.1 2-alkenal reductase [Cronobacter condimenti 1330]CCJ73862.1 Chaperone protein hscC (Hsc62) [Cronobacter condimenti 1330]
MIVGIDLGTTNSLAAVWEEGNPRLITNALGELLTPSVVGLDDEGRVLVGKAARERLHTHPHLTTALFKRHMGTAWTVRLGDKLFRAEELSALVLQSLKEDIERACGEPVTEAVISVPAYFSDAQRKATRVAGELAGLKVEKLINEPTAAALAYGLHRRGEEGTFLVFDLGGGTFDVSVLELFEGVMEVRASAGDNFLGGEDFDQALIDFFVARQMAAGGLPDPGAHTHALRREAERVRQALGDQHTAVFTLRAEGNTWSETIHQGELSDIFAPLLTRLRQPIERALRDARIRVADLDEILLVGGATRMPLVRRLAASLFGRFPSVSVHPDEAVALGAAVQAALKKRDAALEEVVLTDVCPYTLGIETVKSFGRHHDEGHYLPIIERNVVVPVSRVKTVSTLYDNQTMVAFTIYQGESRLVKDNIELGHMRVPVPPKPAGEVSLDVRFTYDINGILEAEVTVPLTGQRHQLIIENNPGVLTPDEIAQRLAGLQALKIHPRERQPNTHLLARLDRLYQENTGELREEISYLGASFHQALESQDDARIEKARQEITQQADAIEAGMWLF